MESMVILTVCAALYFFYNNRDHKAVACLLIAPLIHPNAAYFSGAGIIYFLVKPFLDLPHPKLSKSDKIIFLLTGLAWAAFAVYAFMNWEAFNKDLTSGYPQTKPKHG